MNDLATTRALDWVRTTAPASNDRMAVDWRPLDKLHQAPSDPRRYTGKEINKATAMIKRFGLRLPVVISADGCVLAHYVAVVAARRAGLVQVPVVYADDLPPIEQQALSIALNRFYEFGEFDRTMLGDILTKIEIELPELKFEEIGFDTPELDKILASKSRRDKPEPTLAPARAIVSQLGDVWLLGRHRVTCGDATLTDSYTRLLDGRLAQMCFTDPPYGCRVKGFVSTRGHREFVQGSSELDNAGLSDLFTGFCRRLREHCAPGAIVELCIDWRSMPLLMEAARTTIGDMVNLAVWVKDRAGMGSFLRSQHELVLIYAVPGGGPRNNVELGKHGRHRSNVWSYPCAMSFARTGAEGDLLEDHPTPKPKDLVADAMLDCTDRGGIVLDPFLGSGSTLIAAEKTGRICCGMDLDPGYVDLAVRRWQSWTGKQAVHAETGRPFDDLLAGAELLAEGRSHD